MGLLTLVEDRPTPKAVYNWRVYACAGIASFASCMIGYDSAFIGTTLALPSFGDEFGFDELTDEKLALTKANIVSVYQAGAFFGALSAYTSAHFLGRKKSLWVFSMIFILGAGLMLGANGDRGLGLIYGGRVLAGLGEYTDDRRRLRRIPICTDESGAVVASYSPILGFLMQRR